MNEKYDLNIICFFYIFYFCLQNQYVGPDSAPLVFGNLAFSETMMYNQPEVTGMIQYIENEVLRVGVKELGAELTSVFDKERPYEYLWQGDPAVWAGQSYILFPAIGRLRGDRYTLGGKTYDMPKHGVARKRPFEMVENTGDSMTFLQTEDDDTLKLFPYRYKLYETLRLDGRSLTVDLTVENNNDRPMYFALGGHPGFNCRIGDVIEFESPETLDTAVIDMAEGLRSGETLPVLRNEDRLTITAHSFDNDALILENIKSAFVTVQSFGGKRPIRFFSNARWLGVWAKPGAPYVCLEPWCGIDDSVTSDGVFETKEGNNRLAPGETFTLRWRVEL